MIQDIFECGYGLTGLRKQMMRRAENRDGVIKSAFGDYRNFRLFLSFHRDGNIDFAAQERCYQSIIGSFEKFDAKARRGGEEALHGSRKYGARHSSHRADAGATTTQAAHRLKILDRLRHFKQQQPGMRH